MRCSPGAGAVYRLAFHRAGKLIRNAVCDAFNGRMRDELLNETVFYDLGHARGALACSTAAYNRTNPHSTLGYLTPATFAQTWTATADRLRNPDQLRRSPQPLFSKWINLVSQKIDDVSGPMTRLIRFSSS
jgi:Integrase core domain